MNTQNTPKIRTVTNHTFSVPCDVMTEIALIILQGRLTHEITSVKENRREIVLGISCDKEINSQQEAVKNITTVLEQYHDIRYGESDMKNWQED